MFGQVRLFKVYNKRYGECPQDVYDWIPSEVRFPWFGAPENTEPLKGYQVILEGLSTQLLVVTSGSQTFPRFLES